MAKKKKGGKTEDNRPAGGAPTEPSLELTGAALFLIAAVISFGYAAHFYLAIDYAPAFVGLTLFLALVGWTSGGGMGEAKNFDQKNGIIGIGVALILLVAVAPHTGNSSAKRTNLAENSGGKTWKPSMDDVLPNKGGKPTNQPMVTPQPAGQTSQSAMGLLAALKNAPPAMPEGPPTEEQLQRAGECARRFFWGFVNKDAAVMEGESSLAFGDKVNTINFPENWVAPTARVDLKEILINDQNYDGSAITVALTAGQRKGKVVLTKDIDWEVTAFEPVP